MIVFSGNNAARLALNILKALQKVIWITRGPNIDTKARDFFEAVRPTMDRAKLLADMVRTEVKKIDPQDPPSHLSLLQQLESQIVQLREALVNTIRIAKKGIINPENISTVLNNSIRSTGRIVKEVITTAKDIESLAPKDTASVLDSITHGEFRTEFEGADSTNMETGLDDPNQVGDPQSNFRPRAVATSHHLSAGDPQADPTSVTTTRTGSESVSSPSETATKIAKGIELFNQKWKTGLQFLIQERIVKDDTKSVAKFLFQNNDSLSKEQLGEILAGVNEDDIELLSEFTSLVDFKGDSFDQALRKYLTKFMLPGEAQKISRMMEVFAEKYLAQNPTVFPNKDIAFILAFSIIMLNTDAHNPAIATKDKMTKEQFIWNNRGTWVDGADPPKELLEDLYDKIVSDEIKVQTKGDPDKKGWLKAIHAGPVRDGKRWFVLVGNELKWYKNPNTGKNDDDLRGKLILDHVQVKEDEETQKFTIMSVLPKQPLNFTTYEKGGGRETINSCKRFVASADTLQQMKSWATAVRVNVSFQNQPLVDGSLGNKGSPQAKRRKVNDTKKKSAWRNSFASNAGTVNSTKSGPSQSVSVGTSSAPAVNSERAKSFDGLDNFTPTDLPPESDEDDDGVTKLKKKAT